MAHENLGVKQLTDLCCAIVTKGRIPDEWKCSVVLLSVLKGKETECSVAVSLSQSNVAVGESDTSVFERRNNVNRLLVGNSRNHKQF